MMYPVDSQLDKIKLARESAEVRRFHTSRVISEQTIAQHTFNMLSMLRILYPDAPPSLFWAIHEHDIPERYTGDVPSTAKWAGLMNKSIVDRLERQINAILFGCSATEMLDEEELKWLNGLDLLELICFCKDQITIGNVALQKMYERATLFMKENTSKYPTEIIDMLYQIDQSEWTTMPDLGEKL